MKTRLGPTTSTPPDSKRRRLEYSRYAARCSATTVLPVPGPPEIIVKPWYGARMASSCSVWMVATMSRIVWPRARDSAAISAPSPVDDQRLVVGVTHPDPAHVADLPVVAVQPAEDQPFVLGVEDGEPLG